MAINKKGFTGDEVGRLMIADLVTAYQNALQGTEKGLLSDSEKTALVNNLQKKEDIRAYNEYKYLHDFVVTIPMRYLVSQNMAEAAFWKLYLLLTSIWRTELENESRHDAPEGNTVVHAAVSISQIMAASRAQKEQAPGAVSNDSFFKVFRAETLLEEYGANVCQCIQIIVRQFKEMFAFHVFLGIAGDFCNVDGLESLISPVDESMIEALNNIFSLWKHIACAQGRDEGQREELVRNVQALLTPISITGLKPTQEAVFAAKAHMTFQTFQGYAAEFINQYLIAPEEEKP